MGPLLTVIAGLLRGLMRKKTIGPPPARKALLARLPLGERLTAAKVEPPQPRVRVKKFPLEGEPNSTVKRLGPKGEVTNYIEYGPDGLASKRVDLAGASHDGVPTPHVLEYVRDQAPDRTRARARETVRAARPEEIP